MSLSVLPENEPINVQVYTYFLRSDFTVIATQAVECKVDSGGNYRKALSGNLLIDELEGLLGGNDFVRILRGSSQLAIRASHADRPLGLVADLQSFAQQGAFASLLSMESFAAVKHRSADHQLIEFLSHPVHLVRRHSTWLLGRRPPSTSALGPLINQLAVGGMDSMHAHRTLRKWSTNSPHVIRTYLTAALARTNNEVVRARLIDLIGSVEGPSELLLRIATDPSEALAARIAAIGALGEQVGSKVQLTLKKLASVDNLIGSHAALALNDLDTLVAPPVRPNNAGLRIAQLVLTAGLDRQLSLGGRGDTGGVASLLVSLGEALARNPNVDHVLTIGRGTLDDTLATYGNYNESSLAYAMIAIGDHGRPAQTPDDAWEHLPSIKRGLRRVMRQTAPIDLLHLRMADVGTLAGSEVADTLGVPVCFSAAPDPHNVVHSLQSRGELDQDTFVQLCTKEHIWFRARLIERLAERANHLVLFPRAKPSDLLDLLGIGSRRYGQRVAVVSEGIDIDLIRRAEANYTGHDSYDDKSTQNHPDILVQLADQIPKNRINLPLLLSIGRFNPVKGMERVAAAWASDPLLHSRYNLVIVGGDLVNPSQTERAVMDDIDQAVPVKGALREGLVLLGGRPRSDIARLLVATVRGRVGCWSKGGMYVDGALKEEFGLALIEALAAGLVVIAPSTGGPPTYVTHGDTGVLVDPEDDLAAGILQGVDLVSRPERVKRAKKIVEERYSIEAMATQLVSVYRSKPAL
ncbi:MAG: glycosyltransferase involved in cell wall biosynthesis [Limisphaerales bacterium]|jgi:glycosyltransferase involved in cell wall biosynthesis